MEATARPRWHFWLPALLWLPAGMILQAAVRGGGTAAVIMLPTLATAAGSLVVVAPCGLPLALACRRLWRLGYTRAAWGWGVGLGIVTLWATLFAGLLGLLAIVVCALVLSLPVWIAACWLARRG